MGLQKIKGDSVLIQSLLLLLLLLCQNWQEQVVLQSLDVLETLVEENSGKMQSEVSQ